MYRVTPLNDNTITLSTTATIDAAIVYAKGAFTDSTGPLAIRDGTTIRAVARSKRLAFWVLPCTKCKGDKATPAAGVWPMFGVGSAGECELCKGAGVRDDLQCQ